MPLFERTLQEAGVYLLYLALLEMEPRGDPREIRERAEVLAAVAGDYNIPFEEVVHNWIRFRRGERELTVSAFVRWCEGVRELREKALGRDRVCPHCFAQALEQFRGRYLCPECGEVV